MNARRKNRRILLFFVAFLWVAAGCTAPVAPDIADGQTHLPDTLPGMTDAAADPSSDTKSVPYEVEITRPDLRIYSAAGYDHADTGTLLAPGVHTITEEVADREGFLWGKLGSGYGWIDLTMAAEVPPPIPVTLALASTVETDGTDCHLHIVHDTDYTRYLTFQAYEKLTDIRFSMMDITADGLRPGEELYFLSSLTEDKPLVVGVVFYGDFTTFALSFTDAAGAKHTYRIYESGRNGSVVMQEITGDAEP